MTLAAVCKILGLVLAFALFIVVEHTVVVGAAYAVRIALVFVVKAARPPRRDAIFRGTGQQEEALHS